MKKSLTSVSGIVTTIILVLLLNSLQAQTTIFSENFNGATHSFSLNTTDVSSTATGYNPWLVNNSYTGGSGSLTCLGFPFGFNVGNTTAQPAGISGSPNSNYMHITSQEAINDGITCASYQSSDGTCFLDENYFSAMTNNISTAGFNGVSFKFWWMCGGAAGTTYGEVYYSTDGGTTWILTTSPSQYLNSPTWQQATLTDAAFDNQASIKFGFRFVNIIATAGADPGFCIDDIVLESPVNCNTDSTFASSACDSYTSPSGKLWTVSNTYMDTIPNAAACDSVMTISLTISESTDSSFAVSTCDSYTSPSGKIWTVSNTYRDTIPNAVSCDSVMTINLTVNTPDTSVTVGGFVLLSNQTGGTYQWLDCNNSNSPVAGATSQQFNVAANGNYAVAITSNGCTDTSACYNITGLGMESLDFESSVILYPNPGKKIIYLDLSEDYSDILIQITNINGQVVHQKSYRHSNKIMINIEQLAEGIYFVYLNSEKKSAIMKLIKQ
jgi:hypothetical protein